MCENSVESKEIGLFAVVLMKHIIIDHDRGIMMVWREGSTVPEVPILFSVLQSPCCYGSELKFVRDEMGLYPARVYKCLGCGKEFKNV